MQFDVLGLLFSSATPPFQQVVLVSQRAPLLPRRAFLSCLTAAFPHLPLVGLVDWNPAGGGWV